MYIDKYKVRETFINYHDNQNTCKRNQVIQTQKARDKLDNKLIAHQVV